MWLNFINPCAGTIWPTSRLTRWAVSRTTVRWSRTSSWLRGPASGTRSACSPSERYLSRLFGFHFMDLSGTRDTSKASQHLEAKKSRMSGGLCLNGVAATNNRHNAITNNQCCGSSSEFSEFRVPDPGKTSGSMRIRIQPMSFKFLGNCKQNHLSSNHNEESFFMFLKKLSTGYFILQSYSTQSIRNNNSGSRQKFQIHPDPQHCNNVVSWKLVTFSRHCCPVPSSA